jgi:hypothetical protein
MRNMDWRDNLQRPLRYYRTWKYKNLGLLCASLIALWYIADHPFVVRLINDIETLGYLGAFITGIFFVSTFTVAPAMVVLYRLAETFNAYEIALFAGAGAVLGDYLIFRFLRDGVFDELRPLFARMEGSYVVKLLYTPYFFWLTPLLGAVIIASPFPDEVGIGIMGISKIRPWQFVLLSFFLNAIGIFIVITLAERL